jgi:hypothetical protein
MTDDGVVEVSVHVAAQPETVFPFFTDPARYVQWMGGGATLEPVPGGSLAAPASSSPCTRRTEGRAWYCATTACPPTTRPVTISAITTPRAGSSTSADSDAPSKATIPDPTPAPEPRLASSTGRAQLPERLKWPRIRWA